MAASAHTLRSAPRRRVGPFEVAPIGLGCMNLSHAYSGLPSEQDARALLLGALEAGVTFFDTAMLYGFGANEELVGRVLGPHRDEIVLASKCGLGGVGPGAKRSVDGSPEAIRGAIDGSLQRLRTDVIDVYYLHRKDPKVPIEDSMGALAELVTAGKVRTIGLSEVSGSTIRTAHAIHPLSAVQNEWSLWTRNPELGSYAACRELGIAMVAFSPVARGFLSDQPPRPSELEDSDVRAGMPRFDTEHWPANLELLDRLRELASSAGCTTAQLALAWLLAQGEDVIPIPGTRSLEHLHEDLAAATLTVAPEVLAEAGRIVNQDTVSGPRYNAQAAASIDTESFPHAG